MFETGQQLLITLVHGTWGRGFFPRRQSQKRRPFWFEDGSPFLARLSTELGDIPHKIMPLLWSGANSIFVRDETAHVVADHLSAEHAEHPQATQLVIAHSHGGNIALRAFHHLRQRDDSQLSGAETSKPLVVTLATPFIEVHQANFGSRPRLVRFAVYLAIFYLWQIPTHFLDSLDLSPEQSTGPWLWSFLVLFFYLVGWLVAVPAEGHCQTESGTSAE